MIDLFTADFLRLSNDELYSAIDDFARAQPSESSRHDYKLTWTNETIKDVAGFANTFGGILIIGVAKGQRDAAATLTSVTSDREIMTGIASSIATNISPTPSYDIAEFQKPGETNKRFCIVRVRSDSRLYLVTKKEISSPVWVRNANETIRADAAQLRSLIERQAYTVVNRAESLIERAHEALMESMTIGDNYGSVENWSSGVLLRSDTYFKLALMPSENKWIPLDFSEEIKFKSMIHTHYRRIQSNLGRSPAVAVDTINRSTDFYEYRWYHGNLDYEARWRITNRLECAHATQIKHGDNWSLTDVVMYTILLLIVGSKWWQTFNYFGNGILYAELAVPQLQLSRGSAQQFTKLFGPGEGDYALDGNVLFVSPQQRPYSRAYVEINSAVLLDVIPRVVTSLMNPLLRSLGHAVVWDKFEDTVRAIEQGQSR